MHPSILGAALLAALATPASAVAAGAVGAARCPAGAAALQEVFIAADQPEAWTRPAASAARQVPGWRLDWISPAGDDAALSAAALPEAAERAHRRGLAAAPGARSGGTAAAASPGRQPLARRLDVVAGPAWNGYFGLQLRLQRAAQGSATARLPPGSTGWLALVELLPAGTDGSPIPRALVRSVAGPLALDGPGPVTSHLRALRWPEGAQPERLQARGWVEAPDGRVLLMAADRCP